MAIAGMDWVILVTLLALIEFQVFGIQVGAARQKYKVPAPKMSGHEMFDRVFRIQQNTMEQLVIFLPSLWLFAWYVNTYAAAILGLLFVIGRLIYAIGYRSEADKRLPGMAATAIPASILTAGALIGVIWHIVAGWLA